MTDPELTREIHDLYDAFNRRDSSFVTERMSADVSWPRAFKGGVVHGPEAVSAYWEDQWKEIDPHVEPVSVVQLEDGRVDVEVHQVVRDLDGKLLVDVVVHHVYSFEAGAITTMEIPD
jgi:ketosteroid isomerase-like protein